MRINVLDKGYVEFIEDWGKGKANVPEAAIIEAARQSTQGSFRGWELDEKLLQFLYTQEPPHAGPFEFAGMTIEIQAPLVVFREWHRHRTQSYNEMSARYAPIPDVHYIPTVERCIVIPGKNTQENPVKGAPTLTHKEALDGLEELQALYRHSEEVYQSLLGRGFPKEVARLSNCVGRYSRMRASGNLRNWLAFLTLRMHPDAMWEIRQFANAVGQIVEEHFPRTWALFDRRRAA